LLEGNFGRLLLGKFGLLLAMVNERNNRDEDDDDQECDTHESKRSIEKGLIRFDETTRATSSTSSSEQDAKVRIIVH